MNNLDYYHENFQYNSPYKDNFFEYCFSFKVKASIDRIFAVISDTSTINKHLNIPPRFTSEVNGELVIDTNYFGIKTQWVEKPWHWEFGKYIHVERFFNSGLLLYESAVFRIIPSENDNQHEVQFYYRGNFKNTLFRFLYKLIFPSFGKKMSEVIIKLCETETIEHTKNNINLHNLILDKLKDTEIKNDHKEFIARLFSQFDDDELYKIQIPFFAEKYNFNQDELLSSFLEATQLGLLDLNWDVICPHCKGKRSRSNMLSELLVEDECKPCKLKFKVDSLNKIDVSFSLNPKYREVPEISFCAAEPAKKPHILFNDILEPQNNITIRKKLPKKHYRIRSIGKDYENILEVDDPQNTLVEVEINENKVHQIADNSEINIHNNTKEKVNIIFESLEEPKYALNPLSVFNNPTFKSLFKDQKIRSGVQLKLPEQIILFSDVVDSTKFYQSAGDAEAFKQINAHFKIMDDVIRKHDGIIIKTIGDAIMATFKNIQSATLAAKEAIRAIEQDEVCHLKLRFSLHKGPVVAVNHNTGIDYFGNTVNLSAKLQAISNANEISISEKVYLENNEFFKDAEARTYLNDKTGFVFNLL